MADRLTPAPLTRAEWLAWGVAGFTVGFTVTLAAVRWVEHRWPGS